MKILIAISLILAGCTTNYDVVKAQYGPLLERAGKECIASQDAASEACEFYLAVQAQANNDLNAMNQVGVQRGQALMGYGLAVQNQYGTGRQQRYGITCTQTGVFTTCQ